MTGGAWWRFLRIPVSTGVIVGLLVAIAVAVGAATRQERYQTRFTLVAVPIQTETEQPNQDLGSLVNIVLPSMTELARSTDVLQAVDDDIGGDVGVEALRSAIAVELVPPAGVVRISVEDADPARAAMISESLSLQLRELDMLRPAGEFRSFDQGTQADQIAPDRLLGLGLALASGALAGLLVTVAMVGRRDRVISRRHARAALGDDRVPVLTARSLGRTDSSVTEVLRRPGIELVGVDDRARQLIAERDEEDRGEWFDQSARGHQAPAQRRVLLVASLGVCSPDALANGYGVASSSGSLVEAVLLLDSASAPRARTSAQSAA